MCTTTNPENVVLKKRAVTFAYLKSVRGKMLLLLFLAGAIVVLGLYAVTQGAYTLGLGQVWRAVFSNAGGAAEVVIWNIRLPRIAAAVVCGWGLSLAGLSLQSLLRNPLASPSTLGISQGAAFGAAFCVVFLGSGFVSVTVAAFAGAMGATTVILILGRLKRLTPEAVILAGVALSALFASATILVQYVATETQLAVVVFWTFGDVARSSWREIGLTAAAVVTASIFFLLRRWDLNALYSGAEAAKGLGVNVAAVRLQGMATAALVAALVTAFHGVIAFVGLVAPHMARRLVGGDHRLLMPFSTLLGALLLLAADTVGRVLVGSGSLPVGVVTSFMGAPMFLYLLMRGYR
jgi:iron complex transport system permease protein